jgi:hypothetical protein
MPAAANAEPALVGAGVLERCTEAAAALVLDTAAVALGAVATVTATVEAAAAVMTGPLRRCSRDTSIPARVLAGAATDDVAHAPPEPASHVWPQGQTPADAYGPRHVRAPWCQAGRGSQNRP